jgi:hypothetical protein
MIAARTRIGRIKMKSGGEVRLLRPPAMDDGRARAHGAASRALAEMASHRRVAGYCFVAWDEENYAVARVWVGPNSRMPCLVAPDFVRNVMLSEAIEGYAEERIMQNLGYTNEPDSAS